MSMAGAVSGYLTVFLASDQDCSSMAFQVQQVFQGATVTSDGSAAERQYPGAGPRSPARSVQEAQVARGHLDLIHGA
jgi:hypothetical protein